MSSSFHGGSDIGRIVERQMQNWEIARAQHPEPIKGQTRPEVCDFVSISRSVASGGGEVAGLLAERLKWPLFDREILREMARDDKTRSALYERLDERDASWLEQTLRSIIVTTFQRDDYFHRLTETVLALARKGPAIYLGRGCDLMLPRERGLRVHITASLKRRIQAFALRLNTPEAMAAPEVERIDRERLEFRRHHFGEHANDPTRFDLTIAMDSFSPAQAVTLIETALRSRTVTG